MNKPLSGPDLQKIALLAAQGQKIEAVKRYRELTGADLREASEAIDLIQAGQKSARPSPTSVAGRGAVIEEFQRKGKIAAIKLYRDSTPGCQLKEAKEAVEEIARQEGLREKAGCLSLVVLGGVIVGGVVWLAS